MRDAIEAKQGRLTLRAVLYFAWDLGYQAHPLKDPEPSTELVGSTADET